MQIKYLNRKEKRSYLVSRKKILRQINFKFSKIEDTINSIFSNLGKIKNIEDYKYINLEVFKKRFKI